MILPTVYPPLLRLRQIDFPLAAFWSAYLALWPGALWWGSRI